MITEKEFVSNLPTDRIFNCCEHKLHDKERNFSGLDSYVLNYHFLRGLTDGQAQMAQAFMKENPDFVIIIGGMDFWMYMKFVSKMPPEFTAEQKKWMKSKYASVCS